MTTPERSVLHAGILGPYSVEPAVHLVMPDLSDRRLTARNLVELSAQPKSMTTRCRTEGDVWVITTDFTM